MFGLFKKKTTTADLLLIAIKTAVVCKQHENENGGLVSDPLIIRAHAHTFSQNASPSLSNDEKEMTVTWAMKFLMEEKFVTHLLARTKLGPIGTLTERDENEVRRIVPEAFS